jgi:signal transduction histidine kinase
MKSIQGQLVWRLLAWVCILWIAGGIAMTMIFRQGMISRFDSDLRQLAANARLVVHPGNRRAAPDGIETASLLDTNSGIYLQAWGLFNSGDIYRSPSLSAVELIRPGEFEREPIFRDAVLSSGEKIRQIEQRMTFPMIGRPGRAPTYGIVAAKNLSELHAGQSKLVAGIAGVGIIGAILSVIIIRMTLRSGLRPLDEVSEAVAEINAANLRTSLATAQLPLELRPICDRLNDLFSRLDEGFERERRFSADLAHEFRTPLAELRSMIEVGLNWPDEFNEKKLRDMFESAEQMQSILESLLAMARLEQESRNDQLESVDLAELIGKSWQPFAERAQEKELLVTSDIAEGETIEIQGSLLRVIANNLFSNAVDYTPVAGSIHFQFMPTDDDGFVFEVTNTVTDLSAADVGHLFDRFWRRDSSRGDTTHFGLGLSLTKACANTMGCELSAELADEGESVRIRLSRL